MSTNTPLGLGTEPCANPDCTERVRAHTSEDVDDHYRVGHVSGDDGPTRTTLYYHEGCEPFGATRIPDSLERKRDRRERGAGMRRELVEGGPQGGGS